MLWPKLYRARKRLQKEYPGRELLTHRIGDGARIGAGCYAGPDSEIGERAELGDYSYLNRGAIFMSGTIGRFCSVGYYCEIGLYQHPLEFVSTSSKLYGGWGVLSSRQLVRNFDEFPDPPQIGHDVWIGSGADHARCHDRDRAVIGAGAIVTKDVEPYTIVGGVPAKPIRKRFDDESIALLMGWRWWEMPIQELDKWREVLFVPNWQEALRRRLGKVPSAV